MYGLFEVRAMNKLAVILPFWERPNVTKLCFERLEMQRKKFGFDVFVSGNDEDIVPKGWSFLNVTNLPLGNKLNTLIACTKDYDGVIILGSDDFISDSIFELYQQIDCKRLVFYGFNDCHVYSSHTQKLGHKLSYTKSGNTIGVARLWTKATLERMNYKLYTSIRNKGLDSDSKRNMNTKGIEEISLSYDGHFMLDVKCDNNITAPEIVNTCEVMDSLELIIEKLPDVGERILKLESGKKQINNPVFLKERRKNKRRK
jgi:hypothetical protein